MEEDSDDKDDSKRKSRNLSEKKRRDQFNALVNDLSALISTSNRKMDKSTVLKSTIAFLKHHNEATDRSKVFEIQQDWKPSFLTNDEFTHLMLESLDGFIIVFSSSGAILYASESITSLLGYLPADLLNMSIFDLSYELDHECLFNIFLNPKPVIEPLQTDINSSNQISFFIHLKRGGIDKVDANAYELVKFVGYFRNDVNLESIDVATNSQVNNTPRIFQMHPTIKLDRKLIFVGTGRVQTPQLIREMSAIDPTRNEFTSKHSMEWKFLFLDHRAPPIIGYMPFEVLGTSGYDYYHFDDLDSIVACHEELMQKGEGKSCYYRFLTKGQQWIWLQTDFYISYHQFNAKPDYVVCTHKVVSYADVIRQSKSGNRENQLMMSTKSTDGSVKSATATVTLGDFEATTTLNPAQLPTAAASAANATNSGCPLNEPAGALDIGNIWGSACGSTQSQSQLTPQMKSSRPGSSYGNISSTGISPTVKRKRYLNNRGNESDSTSMSADSGTSKQSLMTHLSSNRRHGLTLNSHTHAAHLHSQAQHNNYLQHPHQQHQQQSPNLLTANQLPELTSFHHQHPHSQTQLPMHPHHGPMSQVQPAQKIIPVLPQHPIASTQVVTNNTCQYTQQGFSALRSPQIVAPTFLEPPQYLTAIPVQPVIAPFQVAPVLSPITSQPEIIPSAVVMTPTQAQLQDQLQRKHDELQKLIMQQQDELRMVSEQLLLARYTLLQPVMPMSAAYNNATAPATPAGLVVSQTARNYNFNSNNGPVDAPFNEYGFTMSSDQLSTPPDQQVLVQRPQQKHLQSQQSHANAQQHLGHATLQPHSQNQQGIASPSQANTQQQPTQVSVPTQQETQQPAQSSQQRQPPTNPTASFLSRSVPDLDQFGQEDIDAFLNLSPLPSIGSSQNALNQLAAVNNNQGSNSMAVGNSAVHSPLSQGYVNNSSGAAVAAPNEDSLLTYMQMAAQSSPTLNFPMGISEDGSETQSEDTKLLTHSQPTDRQQNAPYFSTSAFQALSSQTSTNGGSTTNHLPNDLEILPYQMSQEQSQNLFNSPSNATGSQQ